LPPGRDKLDEDWQQREAAQRQHGDGDPSGFSRSHFAAEVRQ